MSTSTDTRNIQKLIDKHEGNLGSVIAILEEIQDSYKYLPKDALHFVAERTGRSLVDLYSIATFYRSFSLEPQGEHLVSVCNGTACHVRGASDILKAFQDALGVAPGRTTDDQSFTLATVNCLGACALGPVAVLDGEYCRNVKEGHVPGMIRDCRQGGISGQTFDPEEALYLDALCPLCGHGLMTSEHKLDGHPMIHLTASHERKVGWMRLSGIWGDHRVQSEYPIAKGEVVDLFCPQCRAGLRSTDLCPECDAPTVTLLNEKGGTITFCSRQGCSEHLFDLR